MKIIIEHAPLEENEVILRFTTLDDEMLRVLSLLRSGMQKLLVWNEKRETLPLAVPDVVYCETVEDKTFVYTRERMYQTALSLAELEDRWGDLGLFRAGKSTVVNLHEIRKLKNCGAGRIEALLSTEERLMISRHHAPDVGYQSCLCLCGKSPVPFGKRVGRYWMAGGAVGCVCQCSLHWCSHCVPLVLGCSCLVRYSGYCHYGMRPVCYVVCAVAGK